jgi:H+/Cl- antiporter ClcA
MPDPPAPAPPRLSGTAYLRLVLTGAVIGVPAALVAAGFLALVHEVEHWVWHDVPEALGSSTGTPQWYLIVGLPVVGAAIVLAARRLLPGDGGHDPRHGLGMDPTPISYAPGIALAALGTLAFGAVLGPEGPLIALGSVVGLAVARFHTFSEPEHKVLATAGSFSAISALFGGPLVAAMLMLEAGLALGAALTPILIPGLVAAGVGYVVFIGIGDWGGIASSALSVPGLPAYEGTHLADLLIAPLVGVVAAIVVVLVRRLAAGVATAGEERGGMPGLLLGGGLAIGLLALAADGLGAEPQDVLFSGQSAMPSLVAETSAGIVLVLLAAKALAYAVSLGSGFRGGPVFPAIFLGAAAAQLTVVWLDRSPTFAVAVGAAAGTAAVTRLPVTSVLLATLLVGSNAADVAPAAVLASVGAWLTATALQRRAAAAEPVSAS